MSHPHAPLPFAVIAVGMWLASMSGVFSSILTLLMIAWYVGLFYEKWQKRK